MCNKNGFIFVETHYLKNLFSSTTFAAGPRHLFLGALFTNERFNFSSSSWAELSRLISFLFESTFHSVVAEKDQFHNSETVFYASIFFIICQKRDCIMYLFENHQIPTVTKAHFHFIIPIPKEYQFYIIYFFSS